MKSMIRKAFLLLMLMLTVLLVTGCYQEVDPWPASTPQTTVPPPTAAPTQEATATPPIATATPLPFPPKNVPEIQEEELRMDEEPTQVPGGEAEPGFNG